MPSLRLSLFSGKKQAREPFFYNEIYLERLSANVRLDLLNRSLMQGCAPTSLNTTFLPFFDEQIRRYRCDAVVYRQLRVVVNIYLLPIAHLYHCTL